MYFSDSYTLRRRGLSALKGNWQTALMATFVAGVLGLIQNSLQWRIDVDSLAYVATRDFADTLFRWMSPYAGLLTVLGILQFFLSPALNVGLNTYNIALHTSENPPLPLLFSRLQIFFKCLGLYLMMYIFTFLWSLLLIIPGIVAAYSYSMAPYLMAEDPDMGVLEAIARSKEMMQGHKGRLFVLGLSFIGWGLLSAMVISVLMGALGVIGTALGLFVSFVLQVYFNSTIAAFYLELSSHGGRTEGRAEGRVA